MEMNHFCKRPLQCSLVEVGICSSTNLIFINDHSDSLENPQYRLADDSILYHDILHPSDRQAAATSFSSDIDKITSFSNTWNMSFNPGKSHTLTISLQKDCLANSPIHFLNNHLEEVQSVKFSFLGKLQF